FLDWASPSGDAAPPAAPRPPEAATPEGKYPVTRKRRRQSEHKITPLTDKQSEAVHLVGEHKGNVAKAARAAGKSRQAMEKLYGKAMKKLGKKAVDKITTQALPTDHRGQVNVADRG